jgi:hypothetical protein
MAHISSIGAGLFTDLSVAVPTTDLNAAALAALDTAAEFQALFGAEIASAGGTKGTATFTRFKNVREFPSIGTPPNIVNVPVYGSKTSQQVQGQADSPTIEMTLNYVPSDWASGTILGSMIGDGVQRVFRFTLMNAEPTAYITGATGVGSVQNSQYYWIGKLEALLVNPQLTDANTATVTISVQSAFSGAYTE